MSPLSLSSFKINKDVKHQSCSWLIKEDLKYFPLCLTWFWVSPSRTTTTGRNTVTRFFFCCCLVSVLQRLSRLNRGLFCFDVSGSDYSKVVSFECNFVSTDLLGPDRTRALFMHIHAWTQTLLAAALFTVQASLLTVTLKEQQPAIGSLSFEVSCVLWPTIPLTSALDRLLSWCIWAKATVKCNWD